MIKSEEKIKLLASDEVFIEKVARNTANFQIEKLADSSLEHVSGGFVLTEQQQKSLEFAWFGFAAAGLIGATGCSIAGIVCSSKASKAMQCGDEENAKKYTKAAKNLAIAATSIGSAGIVGLVVPPAVAGGGQN